MSKKYKLIKEYPGSPELGQIVAPKTCVNEEDTNNYYWEGSWFNPKSFPEFWEEVKELEYELLSYYNPNLNTVIFRLNKDGEYRHHSTILGEKHGCLIRSVKRVNDGEIFTVGDKVTLNYLNSDYKIRALRIDRDFMYVDAYNDDLKVGFGSNIEELVKVKKKPILTTEDKVELFEGDKYFTVFNDEFTVRGEFLIERIKGFNFSLSHCKFFSSREKAEEYVLMNKPSLSLNELLNVWGIDTRVEKETYATSNLFNKFKNLAEQKLKNDI